MYMAIVTSRTMSFWSLGLAPLKGPALLNGFNELEACAFLFLGSQAAP